MDLYQLKAFYRLGQSKSFSETALRMHLTQSAVSHAIKKLEESVGLALVERPARRFSLTPAGKDLWESCAVVFPEIDRAREVLAAHSGRPIIELNVGSPVEFGTTILIKSIKDFLGRYPHYRIHFFFSHNLEKPLMSGEVDFVIDCQRHAGRGIERLFLFQELYMVVASPAFIREHRLGRPADLENAPLLSLDKEGQWWRNFLAALKDTPAPRLRNIIQVDHVRGLINGAIAGLGVSFVPKYAVIREMAANDLKDPFPKIKPLADQFCIYVQKEKLALRKNRLLIDYLRNIRPAEFSSEGEKVQRRKPS